MTPIDRASIERLAEEARGFAEHLERFEPRPRPDDAELCREFSAALLALRDALDAADELILRAWTPPPLPDDVAALVAQIKLCVSRSDVGFAVRSALESAGACIERQARALALHERNFEALGEANRRAEAAESSLAAERRMREEAQQQRAESDAVVWADSKLHPFAFEPHKTWQAQAVLRHQSSGAVP